MDQGFNWAFNSQGIDPTVSNGVPNWTDGWHKVVIVGSAPQQIKDASKGGRLNIKIKAIEGPDAGKEHFIGLNVFHNDPATKLKAEQEMAAICHVTGRYAFQNPAELYNIPFYVQAQLQTSKPTPDYPTPQPRTNFVGYRDVNGVEPGKNGQAQMAGGPPQGGPPMGQPQQQFAPQQQQPFNPGQPQQVQQFSPAPGPAPFNPNGAPPFNPGQPNAAPGFNPGGPAPAFNPNPAPAFNPGQPQQQPFQQQQPAPQFQQPQQQQAPQWSPQGVGAPQGQPQWNPNG